jgi:hypothetical protein
VDLNTVTKSANASKMLQDRFRRASRVVALGEFEEFKRTFDALMERMDATRAGSITAPERCFKKAQKKIGDGHHEFAADQQKSE